MRRRSLIKIFIAIMGINSGCTTNNGGQKNGTQTETATQENLKIGETATLPEGGSITVSNLNVQDSIIANQSAFLTVERGNNIHFIVIDVESTADIELKSFNMSRDKDVVAPPENQYSVEPVCRSCEGQCIAIPVASDPGDVSSIVYEEKQDIKATWELSKEQKSALGNVSDLRLKSAEIVTSKESITIEFTVENLSKYDGKFLALVGTESTVDSDLPIGFSVPGNSEVTKERIPKNLNIKNSEGLVLEEPIDESTRRFVIK
ncbi:hypothetical protein EGH22_20615 [Halomicroarcula sp. F28]|uniref:hypothetical protein n=1 Tax=Haloarcula salinisoli TaxID=2487746 RepID=UPI001C73AD18|nr:hypothetical protein [Halomicroarcula salinisoli]MBX0288737.1 hypothetical protein [Halomicroarcula salinisoli]